MEGAPLATLAAAVGWGAALGGLLAGMQALWQLARRREVALLASPVAALCCVISGAGLAAAVGLAAASGRAVPVLRFVGIGLVVAAYGAVRLARPARDRGRGLIAALSLGVALLAVELPREAGVTTLRLASTSIARATTTTWRGAQQCSGINLASAGIKRPRRVADLHPRGVAIAASKLTGNIGSLLAERLARRLPSPAGAGASTASFTLSGRLDGDEIACYTPLYRRTRLSGSLDVALQFRSGGETAGRQWAASCRGVYTATIDIAASLVGIAACVDARRAIAVELERVLRAKIRQLTRGK
ncbi:MAG: hypothetical protein KC503_22175 [Myxococcales bacterium]|nr:hypothetical protein [Myxococcales bacterium]